MREGIGVINAYVVSLRPAWTITDYETLFFFLSYTYIQTYIQNKKVL